MDKNVEDVKQRVGENLNELREELGDRTQELRETVGNYVDANPLTAVGIAFGVGYLLSGALFSRTTFKAAAVGGRFALGGLVKQLIGGIGPGMIMAAMTGRREEEGASSQSQSQSQRTPSGGNGNKAST
ncbi:MAG: hypothetical protein JWM53_4528 [bacterium]|nr:hypothetical protein [bacterium]